MDKIEAFDTITRYRNEHCLCGEFDEAIEVALYVLKPKKYEYVYTLVLDTEKRKCVHLSCGEREDMQKVLLDYRVKVIELLGCDSRFKPKSYGTGYNHTTSKRNVNELPFFFNGDLVRFRIFKVRKEQCLKLQEDCKKDARIARDLLDSMDLKQ